MRLSKLWSGALLGLAIPIAASAQQTTTEAFSFDKPAVALEVGGGVGGFADPSLGDITNVGGIWNVRATVMPAWPVALEVGYLGSLNDIDSNQYEAGIDAQVAGNGGQALVRANVLELAGVKPKKDLRIEPYVAAGASYTNLAVIGDDRNDPQIDADFRDSDDLFGIPAAIGVDTVIQDNFSLGARVAYNYHFDNDLTRADDDDDAQSWGAMANVGVTF